MPHFASLQSLEQIDALAVRYHVRPSELLHGSYLDFCIDEAAALAGEARETRLLEAAKEVERQPVRRVQGLLVGTFSREE